jgi:methyl-accepting chemotaxis protein
VNGGVFRCQLPRHGGHGSPKDGYGQIEEQQTTIASAVEEQSAVSNEMSASISGVATATQSVAQVVEKLHETADGVAAKAAQIAGRV